MIHTFLSSYFTFYKVFLGEQAKQIFYIEIEACINQWKVTQNDKPNFTKNQWMNEWINECDMNKRFLKKY